MKDSDLKTLLKELVTMKRLLILIAGKNGATQAEIGDALGVSERQVRNILGRKKAVVSERKHRGKRVQIGNDESV